MEILEALELLGLSEKEAKVYMTLLGWGSASVYLIAQKSGLKRPTTYVIVDELIKKGVVTRVPRVRKQLYQATLPDELFAQVENRFHMVKQKMPEILALVKGNAAKPRVYYFEGPHGLQQTLQYGLKKMKDKEIVGFYATATKKVLEQFGHFKDFNNSLKDLHISMRGVVPDDPQALKEFRDTDFEYDRDLKVLPKADYSTTVSIELGDTFVKIQDFDNLQAIIIENELITEALKQIFEIVWKRA